jgi:hypothetical protein
MNPTIPRLSIEPFADFFHAHLFNLLKFKNNKNHHRLTSFEPLPDAVAQIEKKL